VIYFAGHGYEKQDGLQITHYLCPHDFDETNLLTTSINLKELTLKVSAFNCKQVLFILDCCFSGGIFEEQKFPFTLNDFILVSHFLRGIWAITAGGTEKVKEEYLEGKMRGVFHLFPPKSSFLY